jgi:hypothetical protein
VHNLLKLPASGSIAENTAGEFAAAKAAVRADDFAAKNLLNLEQGGLAGLDDLASEEVRVNDGKAALAQECGGGGFAHPDATGDPEQYHGIRTAR